MQNCYRHEWPNDLLSAVHNNYVFVIIVSLFWDIQMESFKSFINFYFLSNFSSSHSKASYYLLLDFSTTLEFNICKWGKQTYSYHNHNRKNFRGVFTWKGSIAVNFSSFPFPYFSTDLCWNDTILKYRFLVMLYTNTDAGANVIKLFHDEKRRKLYEMYISLKNFLEYFLGFD